jgi:DNA repair protein RecN (Recombination protein N)
MISMNPGEPLRPLHKVASGGELSRIMLALKVVMADEDGTETLIFDEIDSGISGRTAQKISEKIACLAKKHQVICITHLAQIASMADVHFYIEKNTVNNSTETSVRKLMEEESVMELARIIGGAEITDTVIESAREMKKLAQSRKYRVIFCNISG